jgi:hypothetical protein
MSTSFCATEAYSTRFAALQLKAPGVSPVQGAQAEVMLESQTNLSKSERDELKRSSVDMRHGLAKQVYHHLGLLLRGEGRTHCVFMYHPENDWYPDFENLIQQGDLPANFCGISDNLDALCAWMRVVREQLMANTEDGKDLIFRLCIPTYQNLAILEPIMFPKEIYPLQVEGLLPNGPFIGLNIPRRVWHQVFKSGCKLIHLEKHLSTEETIIVNAAPVGIGLTWLGLTTAAGLTTALTLAAPAAAPLAAAVAGFGGIIPMKWAGRALEERYDPEGRLLGQ